MKLNQKSEQYQICRVCGYDRNENNATHCEACKFSLVRPSIAQEVANLPARLGRDRTNVATTILLSTILAGFGVYSIWSLTKQNNSHPTRAESSSVLGEGAEAEQQLSNSQVQRTYTWMRQVPDVPAGVFSYGGATCFAAMTAHGMNAAIESAQPQFHLRYTEPLTQPPGCSTGIEMLLSGELSFAQNGRPLTVSEYDEAKKRNFSLQQVPVAIDGIVFFTHPDSNISRLTLKQLQDIYTGKIKNWSLLGGPNLPIIPISQDIKVHNTLKLLLGQRLENLSSNVKIVRDYTTAIRQVASTSGGISYSSASILQGQKTVRSLALASSGDTSYVSPFTSNNKVNVAALRDGTYPITRRLFVVIRRDGSLDQKAGIAYANMLSSVEGQQFIEKAGFAAIYLNFQ